MSGSLDRFKRLPTGRREFEAQPGLPKSFARIYGLLLVGGVISTVGVCILLLALTCGGGAGIATKLDVVQTALLFVGGSGALAGLYIAFRKQRTDEATDFREQDRLFTERFTQAAAQLGSSVAAVRLAGVYALARIADDSIRDRDACLKVLCEFLRMPPGTDSIDPADRGVRTTAQATIAERLHTTHPGFWPHADVDLGGAHLIELDLSRAAMRSLRLDGATCVGVTKCDDLTVNEHTLARDARFNGYVRFARARFGGGACFAGSVFSNYAAFGSAEFGGAAAFEATVFEGYSVFRKATFSDTAAFTNCVFTKDVDFFQARFFKQGGFFSTTFCADTEFGGVQALPGEMQWPGGFAEPVGMERMPLPTNQGPGEFRACPGS
jgi:hypothetical protein